MSAMGPTTRSSAPMFSGFIDHYSRAILEGRYFLTEDFVALRFGFRRLLGLHGLPAEILSR